MNGMKKFHHELKLNFAFKFILIMAKPLERIKNWFFELIEDAVGEKTMKQYKEEMEAKNKSQGEKD